MKSDLDSYKCSHEELTTQKNELNRTLTLLDKTNSELETLRSEKFELSCRSEKLSKENKDLLNQVESLQGELEQLRTDGQELSKQQVRIVSLVYQSESKDCLPCISVRKSHRRRGMSVGIDKNPHKIAV